ncbi:MAG: hypothetical protein V3V75_07405, partial [Thermoguttaceae bacterium]
TFFCYFPFEEDVAMYQFATAARFSFIGLMLIAFLSVCWAEAAAQEPTVVRVEEDWELVIGDPDQQTDAPQIVCVISPQGDVASIYQAFELNGRSLPSFGSGGLQLQVWDGDVTLSNRTHPNGLRMQEAGETVDWTQCMSLSDGKLTFEIDNGVSSTWAGFGGQGYLKASVDTTLENLNGYNPEVSVNNSGVSYAANRVQSLVLKRVRIYMSDGQVFEDNTERVVHSLAAP